MAKRKNRFVWEVAVGLAVVVQFVGTAGTANGRKTMGWDRPTAWKGRIGQQTDWISLGQFELVSGKLLVEDPSGEPGAVYPSYGHVLVNGKLVEIKPAPNPVVHLPPGTYVAEVRCMQWGKDRRVSRLRVVLKGSRVQLGKEIGGVNTDTAVIGVCDLDVFSAAWDNFPGGDPGSEVEYHVTGEEKYGVFALDKQHRAAMVFARTGFGDGGFSIYELVSGSKRVGVEIVFIKEKEPYPF
jgi:hypothetical protein